MTMVLASTAFDVSSQSNFVAYWGQSSAGSQKSLGEYCGDSSIDVIVMAFLYQFPNTKLDLSATCRSTFPGSELLHCPDVAADIKKCQSQGKAVILSMGGAAGAYGFSSDDDGKKYADTVWDMFLGGSGSQRPFDDAVLDGVDLDIEGGSTAGYAAYVAQLRSHFEASSDKKYYITGAPQCPFPDAMLGSTLNSAWFDMVFVQFYNNFCGLDAYPQGFNYGQWDTWAKSQSANKNVKLYIGAPGSQSAAGRGYVDASTINSIASDIRSKYTSFGGVMTWDASQAFDASSWGQSVSSALKSGGSKKRALEPLQGRFISTRSANVTAGAMQVKLELVEGSDVYISDTENTFGFHVRIQSADQPIRQGWELHIPLPVGVSVAQASAQAHNIRVHDNTLVVVDGSSINENMAVAFRVAGQHIGNEFGLPDPAKIMLYTTA
ncbi:Chitinase 2 [Coemansia sp. RSA 532]|nr:Chitinase 2 [Coemansia sp. RSA 532]KAJ2200668.1 Chitinase 2 [Coemansia sp. RSA 522]KAJ2272151.1 Chitinase 2 [Coemansia sp. RSA 371]KAJ2533783.1 Chitinase 2 [Coemansia sp. RSA 1937]KAJ2729913.1 Chitinase 2 [Coemansia sp. D1744]